MNAPYLPDMTVKGKIRRRITRFADRKPLPKTQGRYVSFSFDDFPKSSASNGAQQLEQHNLRGTYYACSGQLGQSNHFGELCSREDIQQLFANGHEIGCHTENHIDCAVSHPAVIELDVARNLVNLSAMGVSGVTSFAFPYGDVSFAAKKAMAARYTTLRGVQPGINHHGSDANQLLAVPLEGSDQQFETARSFLEKLSAKPGWLIFYTHDVRENCSPWGCTPQHLRQIIVEALERDFTIAPISEVYAKIQQESVT